MLSILHVKLFKRTKKLEINLYIEFGRAVLSTFFVPKLWSHLSNPGQSGVSFVKIYTLLLLSLLLLLLLLLLILLLLLLLLLLSLLLLLLSFTVNTTW